MPTFTSHYNMAFSLHKMIQGLVNLPEMKNALATFVPLFFYAVLFLP
ncbi:hypothetical protein ACRN9V_08065 [Shewanella baltica]